LLHRRRCSTIGGMSETPGYALLGRVNTPAELRALPAAELPQLAVELRRYLIETLGRVGGHFAANLGTVELTLALHRCFDTPHDKLVWDIVIKRIRTRFLRAAAGNSKPSAGSAACIHSASRRERVRRFQRRSCGHRNLSSSGHRHGTESSRRKAACRRRGRRRRHDRRHVL